MNFLLFSLKTNKTETFQSYQEPEKVFKHGDSINLLNNPELNLILPKVESHFIKLNEPSRLNVANEFRSSTLDKNLPTGKKFSMSRNQSRLSKKVQISTQDPKMPEIKNVTDFFAFADYRIETFFRRRCERKQKRCGGKFMVIHAGSRSLFLSHSRHCTCRCIIIDCVIESTAPISVCQQATTAEKERKRHKNPFKVS